MTKNKKQQRQKPKKAAKGKKRQQRQRAKVRSMPFVGKLMTKTRTMIGEAQQLALAMALPGHVPAQRMPTFDMPRTSVMTVMDQFGLTNSTTNVVPNWAAGETLIAFYGQPGRLALIGGPTLTTGTYTLVFMNSGGSNTSLWSIGPTAGTADEILYWPIASGAVSSGTPPHGTSLTIGVAKSRSYVMANIGDNFAFDYIGAPWGTGTGTAYFEIYQWQGRDIADTLTARVDMAMTAGVLTSAFYTFTQQGYYTVAYAGTNLTAGALGTVNPISMRFTCSATSGWRNITAGDFDPALNGDPAVLHECRVTGSSFLMTNTSALTNRQGTFVAARMKALDALALKQTNLNRAAEKYTGDAANGIYTFREFTESAQTFRDWHVSTSQGVSGVAYDLDTEDFYHFIYLNTPTAANQFTLTFDTSLEFRTESARYAKDVSKRTHGELIEARRVINAKPEWFYENPLHMSDIYGFIKRAGRAMQSAAPYLAAAGSLANPAGAGSYQALAKALQALDLS